MAKPRTLSKADVFDLFMSSKEWKPNNTRRLFALTFIGLPGTGKSYISERLSGLLGVPVCSNDEIRRFLNKLGYGGNSPNQNLVEFIAEFFGSSRQTLVKNSQAHAIASLLK